MPLSTPAERLRAALIESFPNCPPPLGEVTPKYFHELASYLHNLDNFYGGGGANITGLAETTADTKNT